MKALKLFTFITLLSFLGACAQKGKAPVNIKLNVGAAFTGVAANGGVILYGTNGIDEFQVGLADPNQQLTLNLSFGTWRFLSIAWAGDGTGQKFTGAQRCEDFTQTIQGPDSTVNLILTQAKCASPIFASAAMKLAGQFRPVDIYSCLSLSNITTFTDTCNMNVNNTGRTLGFSNSIRVVFEGWSSFGAPMPELSTTCISKNSLMDSKFNQQLNLPLEGDIPFLVVGYEDLNCTKPSETYDYDSGLGNLTSIDKSLAKNATTYNSLYLADNFVGAYSTALIDQIPYFKCGATNDGSCLPTATYTKYDGINNNFDSVHSYLTLNFGTSDGKEAHKMGNPAYAIVNGSSWKLLFHRATPTISENGVYNINWVLSGITSGTANATWDFVNTLNIVADFETATTTPKASLGAIVAAVNSQTGISGITAVLIEGNSGTEIDTGIFLSTVTLTNGRDPAIQDHRELGLVHETQQSFGIYGAILYKAGYPTCASLTPGTVVNFVHESDSISIQISTGTTTIPSGYAGAAGIYEKAMDVYENGVLNLSAEFNCSTNQKSGYAYLYHQSNSSIDTIKVDMFWDTTNGASAVMETLVFQDHYKINGDVSYQKILSKVKKTGTDTFESWITTAFEEEDFGGSPIGTPAYLRFSIAGNTSTGKLMTRMFNETNNSTVTTFATGGIMDEWIISTRATTSGTGLATTAVSPATPAMNVLNGADYTAYTIDELLKSLGTIVP